MQRSQTEPGLSSENGSVVSALPGSDLSSFNHPAYMGDYRIKQNGGHCSIF